MDDTIQQRPCETDAEYSIRMARLRHQEEVFEIAVLTGGKFDLIWSPKSILADKIEEYLNDGDVIVGIRKLT